MSGGRETDRQRQREREIDRERERESLMRGDKRRQARRGGGQEQNKQIHG